MPRDPNQRAKLTLDLTIGEAEPDPDQRDPAAVERGHKGGMKGGKARAAKLSAAERSAIARKAALKRWASSSIRSSQRLPDSS